MTAPGLPFSARVFGRLMQALIIVAAAASWAAIQCMVADPPAPPTEARP